MAALIWALTGIGVTIALSCQGDRSAEVHDRSLAIPEGEVFQLGEVAEFSWDRGYIFPTYSDSEYIDQTVGQRVDIAHENLFLGRIDQGLNDSTCLLVFLKEGRLVAYAQVLTDVNFSGVTDNPKGGFVRSSRFIKRNTWVYTAT